MPGNSEGVKELSQVEVGVETESHVAQTSFRLGKWPRMTLYS